MNHIWLSILIIVSAVAVVWGLSMLSTPGRGFTKVLERVSVGAAICFCCYWLLLPFGIHFPHGPLSALLTGYLGLPGAAFSVFLSVLP
ncbi:MAG: pro-sigmaK processing inhibitor BofA family protein [Clostridia bacterium]|nr:pro-sigmaK processing inhibitor BofA family protein [Clostridia bacterium]